MIALHPEDPLLWFLRALALRQLRQHELGLLDVQKAISLQPGDARFYLLRARLNARLPAPTFDSLDDVQHAVTLCDSAEMRRTLAEWLAAAGRYAEAVAAYTLALSKDRDDAASYNGRSTCLHKLGQLRAAEEDEQHYKALKGQESWVADYRRRASVWRMLQSKIPPTADSLFIAAAPSSGSLVATSSAASVASPMVKTLSDLVTESHPQPVAAVPTSVDRLRVPERSRTTASAPERARTTGSSGSKPARPMPPRISAPAPEPVRRPRDEGTPTRANDDKSQKLSPAATPPEMLATLEAPAPRASWPR